MIDFSVAILLSRCSAKLYVVLSCLLSLKLHDKLGILHSGSLQEIAFYLLFSLSFSTTYPCGGPPIFQTHSLDT